MGEEIEEGKREGKKGNEKAEGKGYRDISRKRWNTGREKKGRKESKETIQV